MSLIACISLIKSNSQFSIHFKILTYSSKRALSSDRRHIVLEIILFNFMHRIARQVPRLITATRTGHLSLYKNPLVAMSSAAAAPEEPEVLQQQTGPMAILTLNRPKALNALTTGMVEDLYKTLKKYETNPSIAAILINGAGGKAFCAGGDVKLVVQLSQAGKIEEAMRFFRSEYHLNYKIATLRKPYIAVLDGITMGGGVGVSVHGNFRVATERTLFAMPECAIGLIPDVGGSYFLPRLVPEGLGLYIGLTGCRLKVR
jgi:Enoyl-CoA hydratase/isomerase